MMENLLIELDEQEYELAQELASIESDIDTNSFNGNFLDTIKDECVQNALKALDLSPDLLEVGEDGVGGVNLPNKFKDGIVHGKDAETRYIQYQRRLNNYDQGRYVLLDENDDNLFNKNKNNPNDNTDCYTGKEIIGDTPKEAKNEEDRWENEHVYSKKELNDDVVLATYVMETDIAKFANSPDNLRKTLRKINNSKRATPLMEWIDKPSKEDPTKTNAEYFGLDKNKMNETYERAHKAKQKLLITSAIKTEGTRLARNTGVYALRVTVFKSIKLIAEESIREFKVKSVDPIVDRIRRIIEAAKSRLGELCSTFKSALKNNVISTIVDALLNFFVKTTKNIFKIIRMVLKEIFMAIKVLCAKETPFKERIKAAIKILSGALVGVLGVFLDEAIGKMLLSIPVIAPIAGYISPVISAFIIGIISSVVLQTYNIYQKKIKYRKLIEEQIDIQNKLVAVQEIKANISSKQTAKELVITIDIYQNTETLFASIHSEIQSIFDNIYSRYIHSKRVAMATHDTLDENDILLKRLEESTQLI